MRDLDPAPSALPLRTILARVAADGVRSGRDLRPETPQEALAFLLDRIDGCVLGRTLTIVVNDTAHLTLEVSGRRLLRIVESEPTRAALAGRPLSGNDADHLRAVADLLSELCDTCRHIVARSERLASDARPAATGLSVPKLREALALIPAHTAASDPGADMAARFGLAPEDILAEYALGAGWTPTDADEPDGGAAIAVLQAHLDAPQRLGTILDEGSVLVLDLSSDVSACITMVQGAPAALVVTRDAAARLVQAVGRT